MSLQACADIVARYDPDRFAAAMAGPVEARRVLFPIYAFNAEVCRAPWVASEPMIGEMRLQWWRDALNEIAAEKSVRLHEVTLPLAMVLNLAAAEELDALVAARRWDLYADAFEDQAHFERYIAATSGTLMWVAARALGAPTDKESAIRRFGYATGLARFLAAASKLEDRGRIPFVDGRLEAVQALAQGGLKDAKPPRLSGNSRAALLEGHHARAMLRQVVKNPARVPEGRVDLTPFQKSARFFWAALH